MRDCRECGKHTVTHRFGPATCKKCTRKKYLKVKRRYQRSPKGQATTKAREQRPEVKEFRRKQAKTPAALARQERYAKSPQGKRNAVQRATRYYQTPKGKATMRKMEAKRRGWKGNGSGITAEEWMRIKITQMNRCHYCGAKAELTMDHVHPLSKGGEHSPENIVGACGPCNFSKGNQTLANWLIAQDAINVKMDGC